MGCFLGLMHYMRSLAAVNALSTRDAEIVCGEEFSLTAGTLLPQLDSTLARHGQLRILNTHVMNFP